MLPGCATFHTPSPPEWIIGQSQAYPFNQYLVGVGEADSRTVAEERAYGALARIFKADIEAQSRDWESYSLLEGEHQSIETRQLNLDHLTQVSTKKVLENVRILDSWLRPQDSRFFVLAGLNRAKAEQRLLDHIAEWDRMIAQEVKQGRTGLSPLAKLRGWKRAITHLLTRETANADLRIIRTNGSGISSPYHLDSLNRELEDYVTHHVTINIAIEGDQGSQVRRAIVEGLSREGLRPVATQEDGTGSVGQPPSSREPDLLIKGVVKMWDIDLPDPLFRYVRWCSDLEMIEGTTHRIIGSVSRTGREGHMTRKEARARSSKAMQAIITSEIIHTLAANIYGEPQEVGPSSPACPR